MRGTNIDVDPLTAEQVKERRKHFLTTCESKSIINRGDKRIRGNRFCSICGKRLSVVPLQGKTQAVRTHYVCYYSEVFTAFLCHDSRSCQARHKRLREEVKDE